MADIQKRIAQLQAVRKKTKSEAGKKAIDSKIAKLEAQAQEAKVEKPVEKEVEAPVEKPKKERKPRAKAEPKAKPKKATRFVFEKPVDGGKEVKVVEAMTEAEAKEAMDGTDFDFVKQITRGRSPREGFVADKKAPAKKKEAEKPKRKPRASKDERTSMAKAAGMSETRAKKISEKVATGKKRGRKPMDKEAWLFEMPLKTQAGKVKRKIVKATNEKAAIKSAGPSYKLVRKLSEGESPKVGTMEMEGYVAPPKRGRGRPKGAKNKVKASVKPSRKPSRKSRAAIKAKSEDIGEGIAIADEVSKMGLRMDVASAMQTLQKLTTRYDLALEGAEKVVGNLQAGTTHLNDLRAAILAMVEDDKKMAKGGQTQSDVMKGLNDFAMFALNFPPNFVSDAFDGNQHLIKKFNDLYDRVGSDAVVVKFYAQLDGGNKRRLQEYIADVYSNKMARGGKVRRGGRKMAQGGLAIHFDDDYTHKDEIENLLMSKTYMGDNEYLTDYGSSFYVYSDDISPTGVRDAYESIIEEGYDENVELELFAKGGVISESKLKKMLRDDDMEWSSDKEFFEVATNAGYDYDQDEEGWREMDSFNEGPYGDYATGGTTEGKPKVEHEEVYLLRQDGEYIDYKLLDDPRKTFALQLDGAEVESRLGYHNIFLDDYGLEEASFEDIVEELEERDVLMAGNTYNDNLPFVYRISYIKGKEPYDEGVIFVAKHLGGDVRGNYDDYMAFVDSVETNPMYGDFTATITTDKGMIELRSEDLQGYNWEVMRDETGTFDEGDYTDSDDIEKALDWGDVKSDAFDIY